MKTLRRAALAAILAAVSFAQTIVLPGQSTPVSLSYLYYNKMRWAGAWSNTTTYNAQDVVSYGGNGYVSLSASNLANIPSSTPSWWAALPVGSFSLPGGSQLQYLRIQPNTGASASYQFASFPTSAAADYAFPAQTPGGSLIVGSNTITVSPVPIGVNGSDTNHSLYFSAGTGTAEPCLITGGTAVSGSASGTLLVTCGHTHTGAWTVQSATGGIHESANALPFNGGTVNVAPGTLTIYAPISPPQGTVIIGAGPLATTLSQGTINSPVVAIGAVYGVQLHNLTISGNGSTTSGFLVTIFGSIRTLLDNVWIVNGVGGIDTQGAYWVTLTNSLLANQTGQMWLSDSTTNSGELHISNNVFSGNSPQPFCGLCLQAANGIYMNDNDFFQAGQALVMAPGLNQHVGDFFSTNDSYDTCTNAGILIQPSAANAYISNVHFSNDWSATNSNGVFIDGTTGTIRTITWNGGVVFNNQRGGFSLLGNTADVIISGTQIGANSIASSGTYTGIQINANVNNVTVSNNHIGQPIAFYAGAAFTNVQAVGLYMLAGTSDHIEVYGNTFQGDTASLVMSGPLTGTHNIIQMNSGYNPVGASTISCSSGAACPTSPSPSPSIIYFTGGTVSSVVRGSIVVCTGTPCSVSLPPNGQVTPTWSAAPTVTLDVQ